MQPAVGRVVVRTSVNRTEDRERRGQWEAVVRKDRQKQRVARASREKGRRGEQSRLGMGRGAEGGEGRSLRVGEGGPRAT